MKESLVGRLFKEAGWAGVHGPLMEKAANEILRLTAELDVAWEALTIANTTAANLHDVIRRRDRELEEARERERALREALMTISMRCYEAVMQTPLLEHQSMHALAGACKQDADAALAGQSALRTADRSDSDGE